jgi:hypothetical protein
VWWCDDTVSTTGGAKLQVIVQPIVLTARFRYMYRPWAAVVGLVYSALLVPRAGFREHRHGHKGLTEPIKN